MSAKKSLKFLVVLVATALCLSAQETKNTPKSTDPEQDLVRARTELNKAREAEKSAKEALRKADSSDMAKSRSQIEEEKSEAEKFRHKSAKTVGTAKVQGCKDVRSMSDLYGPDRTSITPDTVLIAKNVAMPGGSQVTVEIMIINPSRHKVESISTPSQYFGANGLMVQNVCPGGQLTLRLRMPSVGSRLLTVPMISKIVLDDGSIAIDQWTVRLDRSNSEVERVESQIWVIKSRVENPELR